MRDIYTPAHNGSEREMVKWKWHERAGYVFFPRLCLARTAPGMTGEAFRLLLGILEHTGWNNRCTVSLGMLGRMLHMADTQLTRALRCLAGAQLVAVDRSDTRGLVITVSPYLVWQGRPPAVYASRRTWDLQCAGLPFVTSDAMASDAVEGT